MTDTNENLPALGSRWEIEGYAVTVTKVAKRGRGYQVEATAGESRTTYRLKDFQKEAKPL